jgi:hypothetical protein
MAFFSTPFKFIFVFFKHKLRHDIFTLKYGLRYFTLQVWDKQGDGEGL